jgi:hypothetical protein
MFSCHPAQDASAADVPHKKNGEYVFSVCCVAQVREWEALVAVVHKEIIVRDEGWLARNTKPCCGCGAPIQKNGGCNHMICSRCRRHFCWVRHLLH